MGRDPRPGSWTGRPPSSPPYSSWECGRSPPWPMARTWRPSHRLTQKSLGDSTGTSPVTLVCCSHKAPLSPPVKCPEEPSSSPSTVGTVCEGDSAVPHSRRAGQAGFRGGQHAALRQPYHHLPQLGAAARPPQSSAQLTSYVLTGKKDQKFKTRGELGEPAPACRVHTPCSPNSGAQGLSGSTSRPALHSCPRQEARSPGTLDQSHPILRTTACPAAPLHLLCQQRWLGKGLDPATAP